jgi:hypothetical protein
MDPSCVTDAACVAQFETIKLIVDIVVFGSFAAAIGFCLWSFVAGYPRG